jgi:radical SAM superfamily enzyme YgiQ (UPF0313 family)
MESILLVNPSLAGISSTSFFVMPPGILCLAAYMREHGYDVDILDINVTGTVLSVITNLLKKDYSIVGVSLMVAGQLGQAREILKVAKRFHITTVVGGAHASQFPVELLTNCTEIDFVVIGEGEEQLLGLAETGKAVPGIAYRKYGSIVTKSKMNYIADLDSLPMPAYDLVKFSDYIMDTTTWHNPYKIDFGVRVPLITSRGCPNLCNFCSVSKCMGQTYRPMSATKVVDMIQELYETRGVHYFAFFDANFTQEPLRVIDICNQIAQRKIHIQIDLPTGFPINVYSEEMIHALVGVGLIRTGISIESGDSFIRNIVMKKNVEQELIFKVVDLIRQYPQVFFLSDIVIGMPEDTKETLEATYQVLSQLDVDEIVICIATPYAGTSLYDQCLAENLFFFDVSPNDFWCADWFSHHETDRFSIKPYSLLLGELIEFRNRFKELQTVKNAKYRKRMLETFGIESKWEGRG